jgi:hypothetical protein
VATSARSRLPLGEFVFRFPVVLMNETAYYLLFRLDFSLVKNLSKTRDIARVVSAHEKIAAIRSSRANSAISHHHSRGNPNRPAFSCALRSHLKLKRCFNH